VAVIGYGEGQGPRHTLNMKSGVSVVIGLREGPRWKKAEQSGLKVMPVADAVKASDNAIKQFAPDEASGHLSAGHRPESEGGRLSAFGHGFNIHFEAGVPPPATNVFMVAPQGPSHLVRSGMRRRRGGAVNARVHPGSKQNDSAGRPCLCQCDWRGGLV